MENREYINNENYCERLNEYLFYETVTIKKAENTIKTYSHSIDTFLQWIKANKKLHGLGDLQLKRIDRNDLMQYQTMLQQQKYAPASINNKMSALYEFFKYLTYNNILSKNPYENINKLKIPFREMETLTDIEIANLLKAVNESNSPYKTRDMTLFITDINSGMRISEMTNLKTTHFSNDKIQFIGKGDKERKIFENDAIKKYLGLWLKQREQILTNNGIKTDYIFLNNTGTDRILSENADTIFKTYGEIAGIPKSKCHFHIFRHTYASTLAKLNINIFRLQQLLGHANISTTQRYVHLCDEDLREASNMISIG